MRGTLFDRITPAWGLGLIPTYAGNTLAIHPARTLWRAHPHVCGEHSTGDLDALKAVGSSPRMRGTPGGSACGYVAVGLIPTYAGNTRRYRSFNTRSWAHPHVCGEHVFSIPTVRETTGSSPRMRGTRRKPSTPNPTQGLIPTYAGNTGLKVTVQLDIGAHPHVCGEHSLHFVYVLCQLGSSPRMRGTRLGRVHPIHDAGLIPTYAGNTTRVCQPGRVARAHPHVCGEHRLQSPGEATASGSSPRMRGTLHDNRFAAAAPGLIPTYAGNTQAFDGTVTSDGAHPHVCGEH